MVLFDVEVPSGTENKLLMDVCLPESDRLRDTLLFLHGGGFTGGTKEQFLGICAGVALATGWAAASLSYRLASPETPFPAQIEDIDAAVDFLQSRSAQWKLDPQNVVLAGGSPGGCIAAMACLLPKDSSAHSRNGKDGLRQCILLNGIMDMPAFIRRNPEEEKNLLAFLPDPGKWEGYSPLHLAAEYGCGKRFLLLHGTEDRVVPFTEAREMEKTIRQCGGMAETVAFPGEGHAWFNETAKQGKVIRTIATWLTEEEKERL